MVHHSILLKKLKLYGITCKNFALFESYLSNRKQYIEIGENSKTCDIKTCYLWHLPRIRITFYEKKFTRIFTQISIY